MTNTINHQKTLLGKGINYLVSDKLEENKTSWSSTYQCPVISPLTFFRAEERTKELGALIDVFRPITNVYASAIPEKEEVYLLENGVVQIGQSSIVNSIGNDAYKDRFRIILRPKSHRLSDLEKLARELNLPDDVSEFKTYYS